MGRVGRAGERITLAAESPAARQAEDVMGLPVVTAERRPRLGGFLSGTFAQYVDEREVGVHLRRVEPLAAVRARRVEVTRPHLRHAMLARCVATR